MQASIKDCPITRFFKDCSITRFFDAYVTSFLGTAILMPVFLSITTLILYFRPSISFLPHVDAGWYALVYGLLSLLILWPLASLCFIPFSTARGVNPHSFGILSERYIKLQAKIDYTDRDHINTEEKKIALKQAQEQCKSLKEQHLQRENGLQWLTCNGYVVAWQLLHSAEEAAIHFEPVPQLICDAIHDHDMIQDTPLSNRQQLLKRLNHGLAMLSPHTERGLSLSHLADKDTHTPVISGSIKHVMSGLFKNHETQIREEKMARCLLLQVRRELNKFRDENWLAIVKQRNHLVQTIALTGGVTYFLLSLSLGITADKPSLIAATALYCIGALAGLFGNFYRGETNIPSVDDYGLSFARLIAVPLLSGLAGIGGVLVTTSLIALTGKQDLTLASVFAIDPQNLLIHLLVAAVFGLTPNLLIKNLQQSADKFASSLEKPRDVQSKGAS
jgi:hypothetical protein